MSRGAIVMFIAACASAGDPSMMPGDGPPGGGDAPGNVERTCPAGQFAVDIAASGEVTCAPAAQPVQSAIDASCAVYLGWRDNCDGCTTAPAKWGRAGAACANGLGALNTCTTPALGGASPAVFGLNLDGDMDGNDKLYGGLHCTPPAAAASVAPCPAGQFINGKYGSSFTCGTLGDVAVDAVRTSCVLYMGWRDDCDGCTTAPAKWGRTGDGGCMNGAGTDNTCTVANLGGAMVNLFGLNPDGDVDNNDKLYVGLHCSTPPAATTPAVTSCPAGQFVTATSADGSVTCQSPAPLAAQYFTQSCTLYFGWRDECEGCTLVPEKWGQARVGACTVGVGANSTCSEHSLAGNVDLFGLNTDGDVDGNDTLYVALRCAP